MRFTIGRASTSACEEYQLARALHRASTHPTSSRTIHENPSASSLCMTGIDDESHASPADSNFLWRMTTILWLFTRSDFSTVIFPSLVFAGSNTIAAASFGLAEVETRDILCRFPPTILWLWVILLIEVVANQRLDDSVLEDSINKPWRPIPAGLLDKSQARRLLLVTVPAGWLTGWALGAATETTALIVFTWLYNDLGGADESFAVRNTLNACGLVSFGMGATTVLSGSKASSANELGWLWFTTVVSVIATTIHVQDLRDMEGDLLRHRRTIPLVLGEQIARWSCAVIVVSWSIACPQIIKAPTAAAIALVLIGACMACNVLRSRTAESDKLSLMIWCVWVMLLYTLPSWSYGRAPYDSLTESFV